MAQVKYTHSITYEIGYLTNREKAEGKPWRFVTKTQYTDNLDKYMNWFKTIKNPTRNVKVTKLKKPVVAELLSA